MYTPSIKKLIDLLSKFPTVGPRTAARFVFYLLEEKDETVQELIDTIQKIKKIKQCSMCFDCFEGDGELCEICSNQSRDRSLLCIVEKETDLEHLERIKEYKGLYFILGGMIKEEGLKSNQLIERIKKDSVVNEIIIAINPTVKGESTALYLERILKPFNKKITRLGRGLPAGAELEYADEQTLKDAIQKRV
ncbi:MAG: recombination mediator RecR [Patescibacteria group bacterium]